MKPEIFPDESADALADCHLHLEGCLPVSEVARLAAREGHAFEDPAVFERARGAITDATGFLALYAEICRLFRGPDDYFSGAAAVAGALADDRIAHAEIHFSPEIPPRFGLDAAACLEAVDAGFRDVGRSRGIRCRIVLGAVRQWGASSADRVLDLHARRPLPTVVGFGMGGDEASVPAAEFAGVYLRARALGLRTSVHAGEWVGPDSVRDVLDALRPDRIDHGIAAADDPRLLERLAEEGTVLCVAPTSNLRTGAVARGVEHPLRRMLDAGVRVALSADDPLFFGTTTRGEYRFARESLGLDGTQLRRLAGNAWRGAFCSREERERGLKAVGVEH